MTEKMLDSNLQSWEEGERAAEVMVPIIGGLYRDKSVETSIFGRLVVKRTVNEILKAHDFVESVEESKLAPVETLAILEVLNSLPIGPSHIDVGKLAVNFRKNGNGQPLGDFLKEQLADALSSDAIEKSQQKGVVLYGFGRIGRLLARLLCDGTGSGMGIRLRAIVVRKGKGDDLVKRANLLRQDSVHGPFKGVVKVDRENNALIINGQRIDVIYSSSPDTVDYPSYGIENAVIVDNTGIWRDRDGLSLHLQSKGVSQVLLTAPAKGDLKNIVHGINNDMITADDTILSAASCTTNAITPILKAMNDKFGVVNGHVETIHSYTNDQNLIDNYHPGDRRGPVQH